MLALSRVAQTCEDVLVSEIREVSEHLFLGHPGREIGEHVVHRNPHAADAWLTASLTWLNRDDSFVRHREHFSGRSTAGGGEKIAGIAGGLALFAGGIALARYLRKR